MSDSDRFKIDEPHARSRFKLVDVLFAGLFIGLLITVLLAGFPNVHVVSGRNQCMNNLKQLALAALNHEVSKKSLPSGGWGHDWIGDPDAGLGENQPGGWAYSVMFFTDGQPQISQTARQPWTKKVAMGATIEGAGPDTGMNSSAAQAAFYCPVRRMPELYPGGLPAINSRPFFPPNLVAKTDYAANGGTIGFLPVVEHGNRGPNDISTTDPIGDSEAEAVAALPTIDHTWYIAPFEAPAKPRAKATQPSVAPEGTTFTGVCWYRSRVGLKMPDGTSKVYLFGEKYLDKGSYTAGNAGSGDEESVYRGMSPANIRLAASAGIHTPTVAPPRSDGRGGAPVDRFGAFLFPPMQDGSTPPGTAGAMVAGTTVDWFSSVRFGSAHAGSFNMAFCDGSVHCIAYDIDPRLHAMLCDRADGHQVDPQASFER